MALRLTKQLTILNEERLGERLAGPHTIAVTGLPRGGTSSMALVLRELGLFMGDAPLAFNHEDKRLQDTRDDPAAFAEIASEYDARHPVWGFKLPVGAKMLGALAPLLRAPILIAVMRSPAAVVRSRYARNRKGAQDLFLKQLGALHAEWSRLALLALTTDAPLLLADYEGLTADPTGFVEELTGVLRIEADAATLARAAASISAPGYRRYSGDLDQSPLVRPRMERRLFR